MKSMKDFSTWNSEELSYWLNSINLSRYSNNIIGNNVTGYDLCYLTNDDFKILGISNIHDKNILVKNIRLQTLEQLKLNFKYENKEATVQLDFDSNFSVFELEGFLKEIFQIPSIFHLCTESNEMLCPNIKIIELILLNPQKYKKLKIINGPVSSYQSHKESKSRLYDDIPRISYDSDTKRNDQSSLSNIPPTKYKNQRNYDLLPKQDNLYEPQSNESNYRTLYYDNNRRGDLDIEDDSMNNSTNIIMNSTPRKYLTDKRINRNSSALMIKPGMALDTNYGRKYNMNYESSNNNSKNESGLNYDYKSQNDYNNNSNDWIYNNDDKKLNLDPH